MNKTTIAGRISFARNLSGQSQEELAKAAGVSQGTIGNAESGARKLPRELHAIATALGVRYEWLRYGEDPMRPGGIRSSESGGADPDFVDIKETRIKFAAGPGHSPSFELVEESEPASYRKSWMQKERLNPSKCIRYRIVNDSHEPFLFAGDVILVNLEETEIKDGKTYAMRYGDELRVKRLRKRVGGGLVLESWNERLYPPEVLTPEMVEEYIGIIGRVRDKSGRGGL